MINTKFEAYKIRRELKRIGRVFVFERMKRNEFKELTDEPESSFSLIGLYHEQNSHISVNVGETTQTRSKKIPSIICLYEDAKLLKTEDIVKMNSKKFKVTGIINIQEWDIVADISLEVFDNGI